MADKNLGQRCGCEKKLSYYQLENKKVKIMIEPGHGGEEIGEMLNGIYEKDKNLEYALAVGDLLKESGIDVVYTRETDVYLPEDEKRELANSSGADLFLSLHRTSNISHMDFPGVEAIVIDPDEIEMNAAKNLTKKLEDTGFLNLGIIRARGSSAEYVNYNIPQVILLTGLYKDANNELDYDLNMIEIIDATARGVMDTFKVHTQSVGQHSRYQVQVGIYRSYQEAQELQLYFISKGYIADIRKEKEHYCVCCGDFDDLDKAADFERSLRISKFNTLIIIK